MLSGSVLTKKTKNNTKISSTAHLIPHFGMDFPAFHVPLTTLTSTSNTRFAQNVLHNRNTMRTFMNA